MSVGVMSAPADHSDDSTRRRELAHQDAVLSALVTRCGQRDPSALARFYELTSPWIYTLVRRGTFSSAEADDAVVAVYTLVWRRAPDFGSANRPALAWLTSMAFEGGVRRHPSPRTERS